MRMAEKEEIVYWAPFFKRDNHRNDPVDWNLLYEEPEQLYRFLAKDRNKSEEITMFNCPAMQNFTKNIYILKCPITTHLEVKDGHVHPISETSVLSRVDHLSSINDSFMFVLGLNWVFFTESDSLNIGISSPFATRAPHMNYGTITPGSFDIGKWLRAFNLEFNLWKGVTEFKAEEDEHLGYVHFQTDKKVVLKRFEVTEKLTGYLLATSSSPGWDKKVPLIKRYNRFKNSRTKELALKEIKANLV
jgi:hypothetical protein